jgi:hypothetical protein
LQVGVFPLKGVEYRGLLYFELISSTLSYICNYMSYLKVYSILGVLGDNATFVLGVLRDFGVNLGGVMKEFLIDLVCYGKKLLNY